MKHRYLLRTYIFFVSGMLAFEIGADQMSTEKEIAKLLDFIAGSSCMVERNGDKHSGSDAAAHVRKKYTYYRDDIHTTEDFIRLSASKSTVSGKPYRVWCPGGYTNTTQDWLLEQLHRIRKQSD